MQIYVNSESSALISFILAPGLEPTLRGLQA